MYPGSHVATRPDDPALIWAPTGAVTTFAELDAAANRLSRLLRSLGVEPGGHVALCLENHPRYVGGAVGLPLRRGRLHGRVVPADERRARLHRRRLWRQGVHHLAAPRRAGRGDRHHHARRSRPRLMLDGTIDGYTSYEDSVAAQRSDAAAGSRGRHRHAVLVGHDRPAQGRLGASSAPARWRPPTTSVTLLLAAALRVHRGRRLPLACADVPRRPAALRDERQRHRLHHRADGSLRRRGVPRHHRALPRDDGAGRADDVRPPAQAARRGSRPLRRLVAALRHPRCGAVPGARQGADDRVVRPGHPRVLRRHRGQRVRLLQLGGLAGPSGHGRPADRRHGPRVRRRVQRAARRRDGHDLVRGHARRSSTTTTRTRRRARAARRVGRRSATSATSTPTASSTSPIASRT